METNNKNYPNLIPLKPGQGASIGGGRKKGSQNRSTVFREVLATVTARANAVTGKVESLTAYQHAALAITARAMQGDVKAWIEIQDTIHGKIASVLPVEQVQSFDLSKLSMEQLLQWQALIDLASVDSNSHIQDAEIVID